MTEPSMPAFDDYGRSIQIHGHCLEVLRELATQVSDQRRTTVLYELGQLMGTLVQLIGYEETSHLNAHGSFDLDEGLDDDRAVEMMRAYRAKFPPGWGK